MCYEAMLIGFWFIDHGWVFLNVELRVPLTKLQTSITMVLSFRWGHEVRNFCILIQLISGACTAYYLSCGMLPMTSSSTRPTTQTPHNSPFYIPELVHMVCTSFERLPYHLSSSFSLGNVLDHVPADLSWRVCNARDLRIQGEFYQLDIMSKLHSNSIFSSQNRKWTPKQVMI